MAKSKRKARPPESLSAEMLPFFNDVSYQQPALTLVLVSTAFVENALMTLLKGFMVECDTASSLFGHGRPLGSYSCCYDLAYSLGLICNTTHGNLKNIGSIRNAFAHSTKELNFDDPEVAGWCAALALPTEAQEVLGKLITKSGPDRFRAVAMYTGTFIMNSCRTIKRLRCESQW